MKGSMVESAMNEVNEHNTILMGGFNGKAGKKYAGIEAVGENGIGSRNSTGELLVEFAERNSLLCENERIGSGLREA